jgi:hypothetical protein
MFCPFAALSSSFFELASQRTSPLVSFTFRNFFPFQKQLGLQLTTFLLVVVSRLTEWWHLHQPEDPL